MSNTKYTKEFKDEAVKMALGGEVTMAKIAKDLGININSLCNWKKQYLKEPDESYPGPNKPTRGEMEAARLKRENEILREERDILKKAMGILTKELR